MDWTGYLHYKAKHTDIDSTLKGLFVPVWFFKVKGGAKRVVDLTSTDDISLVSEFEQARTFKNLVLYLPPPKDFEWLDLIEIATHKLPVSIKFIAFGQKGKTLTHSFVLASKTANITESPLKRSAEKKLVLEVKLAISDIRLIHGSHDANGTSDEEW